MIKVCARIFSKCSIAITLIVALAVLTPSFSYAQGLDLDTCYSGLQPWDYSKKVVECFEDALIQAAKDIGGPLATYMLDVLIPMFTLTIAWFGVQILGGERQLVPKMLVIIFKFGAILIFLNNYVYIITVTIGVLIEITQWAWPGGTDIWLLIDGIIGKIMGFGPTLVLSQGLLGILGATLLSSTTGIFLFIAGFAAILDLFLLLFNIVFMYLMAVTLITFLLAVGPLFIPLMLFYQTERFFTKWTHIILSGTLAILILFGIIFEFTNLYSSFLARVFDILGFPCSDNTDLSTCTPPDYRAYWRVNEPLFAWLMPADPSLSQQIHDTTKADQKSIPPVQSNINPLLRRAYDSNMVNVPGVHFGPNHIKICEELMTEFFILWILASLMKSLVRKIPNLADDIAGALNRITYGGTQIEATIRKHSGLNPQQLQQTSEKISQNLKQTVNRAREMATGARNRK